MNLNSLCVPHGNVYLSTKKMLKGMGAKEFVKVITCELQNVRYKVYLTCCRQF